ncbi:MAG: tyrosine-type recombinase/integrase [Bacteroidetes bacterium]|nr:tyrosine-type recombinase/integrase [Bacteroidota bacterium]
MLITFTNPHINLFFQYLQFEKRYSEHTIISYKTDILQFQDFCITSFEVDDITTANAAIVRSWLVQLKENDISSKSINRKISTLKSFYKYLQKQKVVNDNPLSRVISPKVPKRLPNFVEEKDINTLFEHVEFTDDFESQTKRLVLLLFYNTGIRLSELINLQIGQIDESYNQIKVLGKGNKERIIPVNQILLNDIKKVIAQRPETNVNNVFVTEKGKALQPRYVYGFVKQYLSLVTTIKKKSPHVLRHSFATHLMNNGAELNAVKELLGHSSLAATQVYTHNTIEKLKEVFAKAHPKA